MNELKALDELSYEELCVHLNENQEIIEQNAIPKPGEMILYCERCGSPYDIVLPPENLPYCDTCRYQSKITIKEFTLVSGIDRYLTVLCRLLVRAAMQLNEGKADAYLDKIYDYVYGKDIWYEQNLYVDNPINWYPLDFVQEYESYLSSLSDDEPDEKPDKDESLKMVYEEVNGLFHDRDEMLRKVDRWDIREYQKLGLEIPTKMVSR